MAHFTYSDKPNPDCLNQGDVLEKTDEIKELLQEVHKHYLKDDYSYFIVITQSCDLVRREQDKCKAPYITLAAVRPFPLLLNRSIYRYQNSQIERLGGLVNEKNKTRLTQFLERLFNNNEPEFFYLHEDDSIDFPQSVAFLRLSIAIKSELHYDKCLRAKRLQLRDNFQAKLGWLIGNMYSRVGTEDWTPENMSESDFKSLIKTTLETNIVWIDEKKLSLLKNELSGKDVAELNEELIQTTLENLTVLSRKELLLKRLEEICKDHNVFEENRLKKFILNIKNDPQIGQIFK